MQARSRKRQTRRNSSVAADGNGSRSVRTPRSAHSERPKASGPAGRVKPAPNPTNEGAVLRSGEMDRSDPQFQGALKSFTAAAHYFQKQNYGKAEELFQKVADSAARELAIRARVHLALCGRKLGRPVPAPKTTADHYDMGIAELNARHLELAIEHLSKADKSAPGREHIKYALAAARALQGNADVALEHLKAAIALRPGNRFQVRFDDDFQALVSDPRFKRLVSSADGHTS